MSAPILATVTSLLTPVVEAQGVSLYDIELLNEGGTRVLRLYIDNDTGIDLNHCEVVSRAAEEVLDAHDPIPTSYTLEVSSPGIERKLTKPEHYTKYQGQKVTLKLYGPQDGRKKFTGLLVSYQDDTITLQEDDNTTHSFTPQQVSTCKLVIFD